MIADLPESVKGVKKDYETLYGQASKSIAKLIDKQSHQLAIKQKVDEKKSKKDEKDAWRKAGGQAGLLEPSHKHQKKPQGDGGKKKEKKPKYYLGSSIAGDRKFNAM